LTKFTGLPDFALSEFVATSHRVPMQFLPEGEASVFLDVDLIERRFGAVKSGESDSTAPAATAPTT
jgi:hypothetical protein